MKSLIIFLHLMLLCVHSLANKPLIADNLYGLIAAFGDFNSDKRTDIFVITDDGRSLEIIQGSEEKEYLKKMASSMKCSFPNNTNDRIVNVIPGDFHGHAMMDLLVVTRSIDKNSLAKSNEKESHKIWLFTGNISNIECNTEKPITDKAFSEPLALDYNGDMISDFIVEPKSDCKKQLWISINGTFHSQCLNLTNEKSQFAYPNSNAFIDLSHPPDFIPDIFFTLENEAEIWELRKEEYQRIVIPYPKLSTYKFRGQSCFADITFDATIEYLIPVCKGDLKNCEPEIMAFYQQTKDWITVSDFKSGNFSTMQLTFGENKHNYLNLPLTLHPGDIDGDGYVDFLTLMLDKNTGSNKAVVLKNVPDENPKNLFKRKFVVYWTSDDVTKLQVKLAAFFDLGENGKLDILLNVVDDTGKEKLLAFENTQMVEAYFLKVLVSTGINYQNEPNKIPGTNLPGPLICYELLDVNGYTQNRCAGQLSQSAHFSLALPYTFFGLGETPNFVESIHASISNGQSLEPLIGEWTQIVPNVQAVVIPEPKKDPNLWPFKLFLTPSNIVFQTLITLASICCGLVFVIGILHRKELAEDLAEHEEYKRHWPESR